MRYGIYAPVPPWIRMNLQIGVDRYAVESGYVGRHFLNVVNWGFRRGIQERLFAGVIGFLARDSVIKALKDANIPALNISSRLAERPRPSVLNDEAAMARQAVSAIADAGTNRLLLLAPRSPNAFFKEREIAVCEECDRLKISLEVSRFPIEGKPEAIEAAIEKAAKSIRQRLSQPNEPISILALEPMLAAAARYAADASGRNLGYDLALAQLEDPFQGHHSIGRPITASTQDWQGVGHLAAKTLVDWLEHGIDPPDLQKVPPLPIQLTRSHEITAGKSLSERTRLHLRYSEDYSLISDDVAAAMGVSASTLYRTFLRETGHSLNKELVQRKMNRAKNLLKETDQAVEDIAVQCGYTSANNFNAAFRKETGQPPGRWRRELQVTPRA